MYKKKIAVIGCGMSSAAFYHFLDKNKFEVVFFEKSRGIGGRMSARRIDDLSFDHGATCFGAIRSEKFKEFVKPFIAKGIIREWQGSFRYLDGDYMTYCDFEKKERLICASQSNLFIKEILSEVSQNGQINFSARVVEVLRDGQKNSILTDDDIIHEGFDYVISSAPAPQTLQIFPKDFSFVRLLRAVSYDTTFVLMLAFAKDKPIDFSHLAVKNSIIYRISYENSKGGDRNFPMDCFVINGNNLFSKATQNMDHELVKRDLLDEFLRLTKLDQSNLREAVLHRWLYANSSTSYNYPVLFDNKLKIGAIGDYVKGPRVEMAFEVGMEMAETLNYLN